MSVDKKSPKIVCRGCGGSGQVSFFKGVSRFLISSEECPDCAGLGLVFVDEDLADATVLDGQSSTGETVICYCFGYTVKDICDDYLKNGRSLIVKKIIAEKKAGVCRCTEKNPKGR